MTPVNCVCEYMCVCVHMCVLGMVMLCVCWAWVLASVSVAYNQIIITSTLPFNIPNTHMCTHTHMYSHTQLTGVIQCYSQNHRKCWKVRIQNRIWDIRHSWWSLQTASWGESFSVNSLKHQSLVRWHLICYNLDTSWLEERKAPW